MKGSKMSEAELGLRILIILGLAVVAWVVLMKPFSESAEDPVIGNLRGEISELKKHREAMAAKMVAFEKVLSERPWPQAPPLPQKVILELELKGPLTVNNRLIRPQRPLIPVPPPQSSSPKTPMLDKAGVTAPAKPFKK